MSAHEMMKLLLFEPFVASINFCHIKPCTLTSKLGSILSSPLLSMMISYHSGLPAYPFDVGNLALLLIPSNFEPRLPTSAHKSFVRCFLISLILVQIGHYDYVCRLTLSCQVM